MPESPVTRDGSPVQVYLNLDVEPEFTAVLNVLKPPGRVLDPPVLPSGAGRSRLGGFPRTEPTWTVARLDV